MPGYYTNDIRPAMSAFIAATWHATAIHKACYENDVASLHALVESVSQSEEELASLLALRDPHGWTALHVAVFMNRIEATRLLVSRGADILAVTGAAGVGVSGGGGRTALHLACSRGHGEVVRLLLNVVVAAGSDRTSQLMSTK